MLNSTLTVEVESRCISIWKEPWAKRRARVTLFIKSGDRFPVVMDPSSGFWFLPGGGLERDESVATAAKREAAEELGIEISVRRIVRTFNVFLMCRETGERLKIHPFIVVRASCTGGNFSEQYAPKRRIVMVEEKECRGLLKDCCVPDEYECLRPYLTVSMETIKDFLDRSVDKR